MSDLPVREIVLYKHGIGFFRREGKVNADSLTLAFRHDEINDVLKSLAVFDREGGQVLGIHYQTPLDKPSRLADSSIRLSDEASLRDLLRDLRGRQVELSFSEEAVRGRLVGIDLAEKDGLNDSLVSIVRDSSSEVVVYRLKTLRAVAVLDAQAAHDLHYFLDTSQTQELRRQVTLRMTPGKHKLVVYYVAPAPTWRVSYRLVAESKEDNSGTALLQGWGLFDNRLDEDLEDVRVTLVAGQPISFIYDLYASRIPQRPRVEDEARTAPGPVEFAAAPKRARAMSTLAGMGPREMAMAAAPMPAADAFGLEEAEAAFSPTAEGREAGEFFEYVVTNPVTVKRGNSALVPIIGTEISYQRELLYNGSKLPHHPVAALRFTNTTGLTLERGPVTLVENGDYKGEAIVPFTRSDSEVYLAYAVELGIRVTEQTAERTETAGLDIRESYLLINEYRVVKTTYTIENTLAEERTVTVEAPIIADFELVETRPPDTQTAAERRWRIAVPAHSAETFVRQERHLNVRYEQVRNLDYRRLQRFLEEDWLDQATFDRLSGMLDSLAFVDRAHAEQEALKTERAEIYERQGQLRENLNALKPAGEEGALRARVLSQLSTTEDRLQAIEERLVELAGQVAEAEQHIEQMLAELNQDQEA